MIVFHLLLPALLTLWANAQAQQPLIDGLVQQLGSRRYREREAASAVLEAIGEPAFTALQKATATNDPEVRRRARALLQPFEERSQERQVKVITNSGLNAEEKGRRLLAIIRPGMRVYRVMSLLGEPDYLVWLMEPGTNLATPYPSCAIYGKYHLDISYDYATGKVDVVALLPRESH
jgi:hypothetical protein